MRFHFGFSFRLKHLKKFLFPFLIGILSYFGFSYFNLLSVNALANFNTYFNLNIDEQDYSTIQLGDYSMKELLDEFYNYNSEYYNIVSSIYYNNTNYILTFSLVPKNISSVNNNYIYSQFKTGLQTSYNNVGGYTVSFSDLSNQTNQLTYQKLISCLDTNVCDFTDNYTSIGLVRVANGVSYTNDNIDYNVDVIGNYEYLYVYSSQVDLIYYQYNPGRNHTTKAIKVNDINVNDGDPFITYCDLYDCNQNGDDDDIILPSKANYLDDIFISNIPVNDLSSFTTNWNYKFLSLDFARSISYQSFFYGRKQELDYYTYIPINCIPVWNTNENYIDENNFILYRKVSSINCSSNLNDYDYIYIRFSPTYDINAGSNLITNITLNSNYGFIDYAPLFNGAHKLAIMDKFLNLSDDFNILLSTNQYSKYAIYKSNHNDYTFMSKVDRNGNKISQLTGFQLWNFGTFDNTNLMVYNYKPQNPNTTDLALFFGEDVIVSIGVDNVFSYYDNNNNLSSGLITNNYQVDTSQYDIDYFFNEINEYLNDIHEDLLNVHNIMTDIYNSIPLNIRYFILMFYTIGLLYLVYKVATKQ